MKIILTLDPEGSLDRILRTLLFLVWGHEYGHCGQTVLGSYPLGQACGGTGGREGSASGAHVTVGQGFPPLP